MKRFFALLLSIFVALPVHAAGPVIWSGSGAQNIGNGPVFDNNTPYIKSAGTNYIANGSAVINTSGWITTGTVAVTRVTTNLPRASIGAALQLSSGSATDYATYCFTVDTVDLNTKLSWTWAQEPGSYTGGDFTAQIFSFTSANCGGSATQLGIDQVSSGQTYSIPNYSGTIGPLTFDTSDLTHYGIRYVRAAGTSTLNISDVIVGPGQIVAVPASHTPVTFTPIFSATTTSPTEGTGVTKSAWYSRNSDGTATFHFDYQQTGSGTAGSGTYLVNLPSGMTIDPKIASGAIGLGASGVAVVSLGTGTGLQGTVQAASTTAFRVLLDNSVSSQTYWDSSSGWNFGTTNLRFSLHVTGIPIAEWAGAPNYAGSNDYEVAYPTNGWTSAGSTTAYGWIGEEITGDLSDNVEKIITWRTPVQVGEEVNLWLKKPSGPWVKAGYIYSSNNISLQPYNYTTGTTSTDSFGVMWNNLTTQTVARFGRYGSANMAGAARGWNNDWNGWRYVFVKSKIGTAVGFGLATADRSGLVSKETSGTWTPAISNGTAALTVASANYYKVGRSVTASASFFLTKGTGSGNITFTGLPFAATSATNYRSLALVWQDQTSATWNVMVSASGTSLALQSDTSGTAVTFASLSDTRSFRLTITYLTD